MSKHVSEKGAAAARDRILDAALDAFASRAYERAGLRDVGRRAGADVAYVHRAFGSKRNLFARALEAAAESADLKAVATADLPRQLGAGIFRDAQAMEEPRLLDLVSQSLSSAETSDIVGSAVTASLVEPLVARLGEAGRERAFLIAALLCGTGVFCKVLYRDLLPETDRDRLRGELIATVEHLMQADAREAK